MKTVEDNKGNSHEVEMKSYTTVFNEDGTTSEVAVLSVDGKDVQVTDLDNDGIADTVSVDVNGDGVIDENEVVDISGKDVSMNAFRPGTQPAAHNAPATHLSGQGHATAHGHGTHTPPPAHTPAPTPTPGVEQDPDVMVINVEGDDIYVADIDRDGVADVVAMDLNGNGVIEDDEMVDISDQNISMAELRQEQQQDTPDVEQLDIDGDTVYFADVNHDGIADYAAMDVNGDGEISEDEIVELPDQDIAMEDVRQARQNQQLDPDIAVITTDEGEEIYVADFDHDGYADAVAMDMNGNGVIDDDEVEDLPYQAIAMDDLRTPQTPEPPYTPDPEPEVLSFENSDGETIYVADVDGDGIADLAAMDLNNNGIIDDDEIADISMHGVKMDDLRDEIAAVNPGPAPAHTPGTDVEPEIIAVDVDGETILFADVDRDGIADLAAVDVNGDGMISDDEVVDVSDGNYSMHDLAMMGSNDPGLYATNDPDYINDGNVDDYLA